MTRPVLRTETRDAILDAAGRMVERYGYRKTTMSDIAREAGVGKATLYLYFESKQDLALAYVDRLADRVLQALRRLAAEPAPAAERLCRMLRLRVASALAAVRNMTQSLDDLFAEMRAQLLAQRRSQQAAEAHVLAEVVRDGQRRGELADVDPDTAARCLLGATNAYMPYSLSRDELGDPEDLIAETERLARLLMEGLIRR